jgi:TolB-like protein
LKHALWGDVHVTADSVPKCLSSLRARLEPEACIQTVYKRGYRFSAEIQRQGATLMPVGLRLAIVPFSTGYTVAEHLGAAVAEEVMMQLTNARIPAISVLARDSIFTLSRRGLTAQQIGEALKADLVLTGSLQAFSSQFRLRTEMIRILDGTQIWVEDMLVSQDEITRLNTELVSLLALRLGMKDGTNQVWSPSMSAVRPKDEISSIERKDEGLSISATAAPVNHEPNSEYQREAYEFYLRGRHEWQTMERHRMQDGLQHLLRATELDPSLIPAKVELAHLCVTQAIYGYMAPSVAAELVHRASQSIADLPHRAAALLPALGWVNFHFDRNLPTALTAFSTSAHLPHNPWTTRARTMFALGRHRFAESISMLHQAVSIDPYAPWLQSRLAWSYHLNGQSAESVEWIRKCIYLFPDHEGVNLYGAAILAFNGEAMPAVELAQALVRRLPSFDLANSVCAYALAMANRPHEARGILERLQWLSRERYVLCGFTCAAYLALGDQEGALTELRAADEARCPLFFQMLADPRMKPLHGSPEFERMNSILSHMEAEAAQYLEWKQ